MALQKTENIWHNGKLIPWDNATIHVMSHVVHYGSAVFEGIRCYAPPSGPAIFRAQTNTCSDFWTPPRFIAWMLISPLTISSPPCRTDQEQWRVALLHPPYRSAWIRRDAASTL